MKTKIIQNIKSIILALILVAGVSYVSAVGTWSNPTAPPPGNNVDTPINVGTISQDKTGPLRINTSDTAQATTGLSVWGRSILYGNVGIGTASPEAKLHINGASGGFQNGFLVKATEGDRAAMYYQPNLGVIFDSFRQSDSRRLPVLLQPSGGNVGIGTMTPTEKLDVAGTIKATGLQVTNSNGTTTDIASGSVLIADGTNTGRVRWGSSIPSTIQTIRWDKWVEFFLEDDEEGRCNLGWIITGVSDYTIPGLPQVSFPRHFKRIRCTRVDPNYLNPAYYPPGVGTPNINNNVTPVTSSTPYGP